MPALSREPLLAVVYNPRSRPWSEVVDTASGLCRLLWVVDSSKPGVGVVTGVLRKFGKVIDAAGCTDQQLVHSVYAERPDGVTSYSDADLHRQAWLAEALQLPSPTVRSVTLLTDKLLQREALETAGVAQPRFSAVREPADWSEVERLSGLLRFPVMLKPRDGSACRGISSVDDPDELARLLKEIEHPVGMIVEERMEDLVGTAAPYADRVSIDSIVSRGVISHLGITGLFAMAPPFRSRGGFFPAQVAPAEITEMFAMATACIEALGSGFGCYRTEIKLTPEGRKIIEVNGRPTGLTPGVVKLAAGLPLLQMCMRLALGEHIVVEGPVHCDAIAYRYYDEPPMSAEKVIGISGLEQLRQLPGVVRVDVHKSPGDPVDWQNGSLDKVFQVTGTVKDYAELAEHYRACTEDVVVSYQDRA
jgi:biotin carboxylase